MPPPSGGWQNDSVSLRSVLLASTAVACLVLTACGGDDLSLCDKALSVPSFTMRFSQGLDNFSEDQYEQLRLDSLDALEMTALVADANPGNEAAGRVLSLIENFITEMDDSGWDVSVALTRRGAVSAATTLGSPDTLAIANEVDALVIAECGLPSTLAPVLVPDYTLPMPTIPSPTQTDPPATPPNQESENRELGRTVATLFGLTIAEKDLVCLGSELQDIVDVTGPDAGLGQYQGQFQRAFDACRIDFEVPVE